MKISLYGTHWIIARDAMRLRKIIIPKSGNYYLPNSYFLISANFLSQSMYTSNWKTLKFGTCWRIYSVWFCTINIVYKIIWSKHTINTVVFAHVCFYSIHNTTVATLSTCTCTCTSKYSITLYGSGNIYYKFHVLFHTTVFYEMSKQKQEYASSHLTTQLVILSFSTNTCTVPS